MIRPIVVMHDKQAPKCLYWGIHHGFRITQCRRLGAFLLSSSVRGHHPPLVNVDATDTDKRDELALCLLGEHPSGQRQVGFDKRLIAPLLNSLDKREHLSSVDNTVDKLPTGTPSGGPSTSNVLNLQREYGNHDKRTSKPTAR
jgi:hypothetical protein